MRRRRRGNEAKANPPRKSSLQHYLPAGLLGGFSLDNDLPRRERRLAIGDHLTRRCYTSKAGRVAGITNLYETAEDYDGESIDSTWAGYEADLPEAVDSLISGTLNARSWARTLVPFATGILVRGPDFNKRFEERIATLGVASSPDNTNFARTIEFQRLLAPILASKWTLAGAQGPSPFITNDVGYAGYRDARNGETGIAIPLNKKHILVLVPCRRRPVASLRGGVWYPLIERRTLAYGYHKHFNTASSTWAQRFIFGADERVVSSYLTAAKNKVPSLMLEPEALGFMMGPIGMVYELTWHRLVSYLEKAPDDTACLTSEILDWKAVAAGWAPRVFMPLSHTISFFTRSVRVERKVLAVDLTDTRGLTAQLDIGVPCPS